MAGRAFRVCSVRKGYAGNSECWRRLFSAPFLAISCCWLSGWDSVCIQVFGRLSDEQSFMAETFPKREAFVVVESGPLGHVYIRGSFVSGFRSMGDSTQYYRRVEEFTLVRRCQLSPFVGLGIMAIIYGYSIDLYRTDRDIIKGMSYSFVRFSGYCVTLFFVIQLFTSLHYTGLDSFFGLSSDGFTILYALCSILPLFVGGNKLK